MSKREYKGKELPVPIPDSLSHPPIDRPIAIYYRQSTDAQIGNISTTIQTVDMVAYLKTRGWRDENIAMIDMDAGVSGTKKIDQRRGMSELFGLIVDGKIGAVACQDEDRLFRDVTQIQVNIFIEACKVAHVLVVTPTMIYDFAHPQMGNWHARQFRFKCEMAAEYITSYIRGRLHPARRRVMMEGKWAGGTIPPGFMVDMRKNLRGGRANPDYRHFAPYKPHAEIILAYFRLFLDFAGNLNKTFRFIVEHGPFFDDPKTWIAPKGFQFLPPRTMKNYSSGSCPGKTGLFSILTNAAYIGHWSVNDVIVHWNNHPALIPLEAFVDAFNYLSQVTLDGQPNADYKPFTFAVRPSKDDARSVERPLCAGMIFTEVDGRLNKAGTYYTTKLQHYAYSVHKTRPYEAIVWWKKADYVDAEVEVLLRQKLLTTFNSQAWDTAMTSYTKEYKQEAALKEKQRTALEQTMRNLLTSLETLTNADMIRSVQKRYEEAEAELNRLSADITTAETEVARVKALQDLKQTYAPAIADWNHLSRDRRRSILHTFIERIIANPMEKHVIEFVVHWRDKTSNSFLLGHKGTRWTGWLPSETSELLALIDAGASQVEIARQFPTRKWKAIQNKVWALRGKGALNLSPLPIANLETYRDYRRRTNGGRISHHARGGERWTRSDLTALEQLVARGASQVEISATFPHRNWARIRANITKVCGHEVNIPGAGVNGSAGEVHKLETYEMYLARKHGKEVSDKGGDDVPSPGEDSLACVSSQDHCWTKRPSFRCIRWKCCASRLRTSSSPSAAPKAR